MSYADIIKKKTKEWDAPDLMKGAEIASSAKIPFSSPLMNWCTYGGIPRNKISEFYGDFSSGKTSTSVDICKNAIKLFREEFESSVSDMRDKVSKGKKEYAGPLEDLIEQGPKKVFYLDLEHAFDKKWSAKLGIVDSEIEVMQPPNIAAEQILQTVQEIVETGEVGLIVIDSIPSLVPQAELDKKYGERTVAALAGLLTIFCRKIVPLLTRYGCTMIIINQTRENMDNPYVVKTPGGKAIEFYSMLRILFRHGAPVDFLGNEVPASTENPAGHIINAKITKQKSAPNDRKQGSYFLMSQTGLRPDFDFAKLAVNKYGIIKKAGAWFTMCDPYTGEILESESGTSIKVNGMAKVYDYLQNNQEYYNKLVTYIENDINGVVESEEVQQEVE